MSDAKGTDTATVDVEGRRLSLGNLDKVLYPQTGTTKREVLSYYARIAPVMLPHLAGRPVTFVRAPDGVGAETFFEKRVPRGAPRWVQSLRVESTGRRSGRRGDGRTHEVIDYPAIDGLPALVWAANLAVIEFHVPMWLVDSHKEPRPSDLLVFDLDPGAPASMTECCTVALLLRDALIGEGLEPLPKSSGSKGLQLYARRTNRAASGPDGLHFAHELATAIEREHGDVVVSNMRKDLRPGKVLIDWSQNNRAKTTVAAYSLRLRPEPTVSTPLQWSEVEAAAGARDGERLRFDYQAVLGRVDEVGDLFAPLVTRSERAGGVTSAEGTPPRQPRRRVRGRADR